MSLDKLKKNKLTNKIDCPVCIAKAGEDCWIVTSPERRELIKKIAEQNGDVHVGRIETSPPTKDLTVKEALKWSDKHCKLKGEGVRVVHIQQLLENERNRIVEKLKRMKREVRGDGNIYKSHTTAYRIGRVMGYNQALKEFINQLSTKKG